MQSVRLNLTDRVTNSRRFSANPQITRLSDAGQATVCGRDLAPTGPLPALSDLGDVWLPHHGRFIAGNVCMASFDPQQHRAALSPLAAQTERCACFAQTSGAASEPHA